MPYKTFNINLRDTLAVGVVDINFQIVIWDDFNNSTVNENYPLIKIGEITIGSDKDSDLVYFPGNFDLEFQIEGSDSLFMERLMLFSKNGGPVELKIDNDLKWAGYIKTDSVKGERISQKITLTCYDQSDKLKEKPVDGYILGLSDEYYLLKQLIKDLLTSTNINDNPFITDIAYYGSAQMRMRFAYTIINYYDFNNIYIRPDDIFATGNTHKNVALLLKNICTNLRAVGYYGMDRIFHIVPRFYEGQPTVQVSKLDLLDKPELRVIPKKTGFRAHLFRGFHPQSNAENWYVWDSVFTDISVDEEVYIYFPGGWFQPYISYNAGANSGFWVYYDNTFHLALVLDDTFKQWRMKNVNGSYVDTWDDLWRLMIVDNLDFSNVHNHLKVDINVDGLWDKWKFQNFYKIDNSSNVFRLIKAKYNLYKKSSSLVLKKAN